MTIVVGDCREVLAGCEPETFHAVICDPPYELTSKHGQRSPQYGEGGKRNYGETSGGFMGMRWDATGVSFDPETWRAVYRVLKPGGYMLAFSGTRTSHRMVCAIEDAGFEIRDSIAWLTGQGFPKSLDVMKAIHATETNGGSSPQRRRQAAMGDAYELGETYGKSGTERSMTGVRSPSIPIKGDVSDRAREWDGWGTALKPSHEPICVARKPLSERTVAANVMAHGTGAINVNGCRIEATDERKPVTGFANRNLLKRNAQANDRPWMVAADPDESGAVQPHALGRWPPNVAMDEDVAEQIGPVSRFFYQSKASRAERNAGLDGMPERFTATMNNGIGGREHDPDEPRAYTANHHPCIKPVALMRWLVRMVTPPGGHILDPFLGSGSTGVAAALEGFAFTGIEQDAEYAEIARRRIAHAGSQPALFREEVTA